MAPDGADAVIDVCLCTRYRTVPIAVRRPRMRCGLDGWGLADDEVRRKERRRRWPSTLPEPPSDANQI